jgi:hypothetical protein
VIDSLATCGTSATVAPRAAAIRPATSIAKSRLAAGTVNDPLPLDDR